MIHINFKTWQVYYMNNDGRKVILRTNLGYNTAVKTCQELSKYYSFCNYESK